MSKLKLYFEPAGFMFVLPVTVRNDLRPVFTWHQLMSADEGNSLHRQYIKVLLP